MTNNIVDHIGNRVTVWHKTGNSLSQRKLLTVDEFGVTILSEYNAIIKPVFIHWSQINYIDLIPPIDPELKRKEDEMAQKLRAGIDHLNGFTCNLGDDPEIRKHFTLDDTPEQQTIDRKLREKKRQIFQLKKNWQEVRNLTKELKQIADKAYMSGTVGMLNRIISFMEEVEKEGVNQHLFNVEKKGEDLNG